MDRESLFILSYSDASYANILPDKTKSGEGYLTFLCDHRGNCSLLNWKSNKIKRVVHSTVAAEGLGLVDALGDAFYVRNVLEDILFNDVKRKTIPIEIYTDSELLFKSIGSTKSATEKPLRVTIAELKEMFGDHENNTSLYWIPNKLMVADCLTKIGASTENLEKIMASGVIDLQELKENRASLMDVVLM